MSRIKEKNSVSVGSYRGAIVAGSCVVQPEIYPIQSSSADYLVFPLQVVTKAHPNLLHNVVLESLN